MSTDTTNKTNQVTLTIDGQSVTVPKGTTVYNAVKKLGIDVPIFCYQDRMPPFGACRVCLVEVEKMAKPQTSCTLEATEGMVVKTQTEMAVKGRNEIMELLLINHPLDCPVCDRGGECPLQENAMKFGPGKSRFFEDKRKFVKPIPLSPVVMLDRERCIICARCTRFTDVVAGDHALEFIDRGYKTEVGTPDGEPAESKFIGNTIMICPVGALTSKVYRFRARPWDNDSVDSTCTLCPVGCSMVLDSRDGSIMRTRSRENKDVNDIWMCDKGWFGYEFSHHPDRLQTPLVRHNGELQPASWDEALAIVAQKIKEAKPSGRLAAFGGDVLTIEENYLFQKLMRQGAGVDHVDHRIGTPIISQDDEGIAAGMEMSIGECEQLSYIVLLGLDLTEEFPVIWLRLKQAINCGAKIVFLGHYAPEITSHIHKTVLHAPGKELEILKEYLSQFKAFGDANSKCAVFVGSQYLNSPNRLSILAELQNFKESAPNFTLNIMEGRNNSMGARFAGMRPDVGPMGSSISKPGLNAFQVLESASKNGWDFLYVAGANPAQKLNSKLWQEARAKTQFLVVQDLFLTETGRQADVVLPTLSYVEKGGHFLNIEGRLQKLHQGKALPEGVLSDGEIFTLIANRLNILLAIDPLFLQKLNSHQLTHEMPKKINSQSPKQIHGTLLATFAPELFDRGERMKHNPHLIQLSKEPKVRIHPQEATKRGIQSGDTVQLSANGNTISAKVKLDEGVSEGTIVLPLGFAQVPVQDLTNTLQNSFEVSITTKK
jgi:NADH-quinone oxidoreductase subunit G